MSLVTARDVAAFLVARGLVSPGSVVDGRLVIAPCHRRHHAFRVSEAGGRAWFVKQGVAPRGFGTVAHEALMHEAIARASLAGGRRAGRGRASEGAGGGVRPEDGGTVPVPALHAFDPASGLMVTEWLAGAEDLRTWQARRKQVAVRLSTQLGAALGALHRLPAAIPGDAETLASVTHPPPWALRLPTPDVRALNDFSRASRTLVALLQEHGFREPFQRLRAAWSTSSLVHFDLKWDNCLVTSHGRRARLTLIDWEFAGRGDPAWDVGSALHEYLVLWLTSCPPAAADAAGPETGHPDGMMTDAARVAGLARRPLASMRPAIAAFWRAYVNASTLTVPAADALLTRAVDFAAVRLVQTSFELVQRASRVGPPETWLLQCSLNMLQRPDAALTALFGLETACVPAT